MSVTSLHPEISRDLSAVEVDASTTSVRSDKSVSPQNVAISKLGHLARIFARSSSVRLWSDGLMSSRMRRLAHVSSSKAKRSRKVIFGVG